MYNKELVKVWNNYNKDNKTVFMNIRKFNPEWDSESVSKIKGKQ